MLIALAAIGVELGLPTHPLALLTVVFARGDTIAFGGPSGRVGFQFFERLRDTRRPRPRIDQLGGHHITAPARSIQLVLGGIGGRMLGRRRGSQLTCPLRIDRGLFGGGVTQPLFGAVGAQRRIRRELDRIDGHHPQPAHTQARTQHQHLREQLLHHPGGLDAKP